MNNDTTLPLFDTDIWWQKQLRLIRNLNLPSFFYLFAIFLWAMKKPGMKSRVKPVNENMEKWMLRRKENEPTKTH